MGILYITSDVPQAGRTAFCCALAAILRQRGQTVALAKPLALVTNGGQDRDTAFFSQVTGATTASGDRPQALPSSGEIGQEQVSAMTKAVGKLASRAGTVIVEGLPLSRGSGQLADALDARVIAIVRYAPGLGPEALSPLRDTFGQRLAGVVLNQLTRYKTHDAQSRLVPALEAAGLRVLSAIPEERRMLAATVGQVVEHLDGRFLLGQEKRDGLVEHILIGGLVLEWGINYFGRHENKAVLVRGDRPDIQMAALNTPTSCLILTGGIEPTQYVRYEAQEEEVSLAVVKADTQQASSRLETLHQKVTVHHQAKIERFQRLLSDHVDGEALLAMALG